MTTHRSVTPLLSSLGLDAALLTSHCHHHRQGEFYFFKDAKQPKTNHTNLIRVRPHRQLSICCIIQDIYGHVTGAEWGQQLQWHLTHHLALLAWGGWAWAGAATRQGGRRQSSAILLSSSSVSRRILSCKLMEATTQQYFLVSVYECVPSRIDPWSVSVSTFNCLTLSQQELILCRHFIFAASGSPLELIQMITRYQILQPAAWRLNLHTLSWKIRCTEKCSKQLRWHGISYSLPWLLLLRAPPT